MPKQSSGERRKQILNQRRAEERREFDLREAEDLFQQALYVFREYGDEPGADRWSRRALTLNPDHAGALTLLAQIHSAAGHYAEALGYLRRLRKATDEPSAIYNIGVVYYQMGQPDNALTDMREFHRATKNMHGTKWPQLRQSAEALCATLELRRELAKPAPPAPTEPPPKQPQPPLP
jgi:tetratricopeptide (TPR) repeat protein